MSFTARPAAGTPRCAFTLIEMMLTVAVLIVVLGLMVSLAREVRYRSADQLTKNLLRHMDEVARIYKEKHANQLPPDIPLVIPQDVLVGDEAKVRAAAYANNGKLVEAFRAEIARSGLLDREPGKNGAEGPELGDLPISLYDGRVLSDAWGNPIVFMPTQHPAIGMAPVRRGEEEQAYFFFSAGPDGQYLTREDNLYSYEQGGK